jgi:exportin-T
LKSARGYQPERHARDARVRDLVRERDAAGLNAAVVGIVTECMQKLTQLRPRYSETKADIETLDELVDLGIKAFGSYIRKRTSLHVISIIRIVTSDWIDISLTCSPVTIQMMFTLLSGGPHSPAAPVSANIRLGTVGALNRMVTKGLKEPSDKLDLLRVLDLGKVLDALETQTRENRTKLSADVSEVEEQFRESLGKLLTAIGSELLDLSKEVGRLRVHLRPLMEVVQDTSEQIRLPALQMLDEIIPVAFRFLSDEYDDTTSTIFPFIQGLLQSVSEGVVGEYSSNTYTSINVQKGAAQTSRCQKQDEVSSAIL